MTKRLRGYTIQKKRFGTTALENCHLYKSVSMETGVVKLVHKLVW